MSRVPRAWLRAIRPVAAGVVTGAMLLGPATSVAAPRDGAATALGPDTAVADWDLIGTQAFSAAGLTPAEGHTIFAYVAIAVYDSVMAIHGGYQPFAVEVDAPAGASAEASVAAAAHAVLVHYLPAQALTILNPAYTNWLALKIPDGPAKTAGIAVGEYVAAVLISQRADDGFRSTAYPYTAPSSPTPGVWIPTGATPIGTYLGHMRPFAIESPDQFRPGGPPDLLSKKWERDYNEVKDIGSSASTSRTLDQTVAARFWGELPVQQARGSFRKFVLDRGLDVVQASRFMAMVSVVYADALIACFDAKYHFAFWRPITAIRAGDTDGNGATGDDDTWSPLLAATPNHPEYPSAHSCITPAGGLVISRFLASHQIDFTVPSLSGLGDRHFDTVSELEYDVSNGRIWGGIHYRTSVRDGAAIGKKTANYVLAHYFKSARG